MDTIAWPQKGARLFVDGGNYYEFSHFGWGSFSTEFFGYAEGYKDAADLLVDSAIASEDIRKLDTFIFPILFSYRQYIELELKWIFLRFSRSDIEQKRLFLGQVRHNLMQVWNRVKPLLLRAANTKEKEDVEVVQTYIQQFHDFDQTSFSFRYPIDKKIDRVLTAEHRINLRILKERMQELYSFFDGVGSYLIEMQDFENAEFLP